MPEPITDAEGVITIDPDEVRHEPPTYDAKDAEISRLRCLVELQADELERLREEREERKVP